MMILKNKKVLVMSVIVSIALFSFQTFLIIDNYCDGAKTVFNFLTMDVQANNDIYTNKDAQTEIKENIYPVGSIYATTNTINPGTMLGGIWEEYGTGRALIGVDSSDSDFASPWLFGGEKEHTLVANEIPAHTHGSKSLTGIAGNFAIQDASYGPGGSHSGIITNYDGGSSFYSSAKTAKSGVKDGFGVDFSHTHESVGEDKPHNNVQPYITTYMWRKIAPEGATVLYSFDGTNKSEDYSTIASQSKVFYREIKLGSTVYDTAACIGIPLHNVSTGETGYGIVGCYNDTSNESKYKLIRDYGESSCKEYEGYEDNPGLFRCVSSYEGVTAEVVGDSIGINDGSHYCTVSNKQAYCWNS